MVVFVDEFVWIVYLVVLWCVVEGGLLLWCVGFGWCVVWGGDDLCVC